MKIVRFFLLVENGTLPYDPAKGGAIPLSARVLLCSVLFILVSVLNSSKDVFAQIDSELVADTSMVGHIDSLQLRLLEIEIAKAQREVTRTNFWHRLMPQIHGSASFGVKDLVFVDPANFVPYVLPKDAYRLTLSLSITDILDFAQHSNAELELEKLQAKHQQISNQQARLYAALQRQLSALDELATILNEELKMKEDILKFNDLRFKQGKIEYDALLKSKLDLLAVKKNLLHLNQQKLEIQSKLSNGARP